MANPAGYDPVAGGLKGRCLSIRLYARDPDEDPAFERVDHDGFLVLVHQHGFDPCFLAYRASALATRRQVR